MKSQRTHQKKLLTYKPHPKWMEEISNCIEHKKIQQLAIPGTHDSCTSQMDNRFLNRMLQCQNLSIDEQLDYGIRYFDLRFENCGVTKGYKIHHGGYTSACTLEHVLDAVVDFLNTNTKEIVIFKLTHFRNFSSEDMEKFTNRIFERCGSLLIPKTHYNYKLLELWKINKRLIVLTSKPGKSDLFWPINYIDNYWFDQNDINSLKELCDEAVNRSYECMWVLQAILTPRKEFYSFYMGVKGYSNLIEKQLSNWLTEWSKSKINIVIVDFCECTNIVQDMIQLNKSRSV
jgi:hypothetical protein